MKNEEQNILACISSVRWADDVWVVDSQSSDLTCEIANRAGAKIVQFNYSGQFPKKKNWALANLPFAHDWVLILDADERVTPELRDEIITRLQQADTIDGFFINRRLIFLGRWIRHCGWYPSWNMRLFKHKVGRYERFDTEDVANTGDVEVHEHVIVAGRTEYLRCDLLHDDFKSIYHFIERHNRYSNWDARVYANFKGGKDGMGTLRASLLGGPLERKRWLKRLWARVPARPLWRFVWMYFIKMGFLDGRPGLIFCMLISFHEAVIDAKIFESGLVVGHASGRHV